MENKLIVANWKMNGDLFLTKSYADIFKNKSFLNDIVVCPPFIYLWSAIGGGYDVGAQDCHFASNGPYTGSISAEMLKNMGVKYVILGHSERRQNLNETDILIENKAKKAISEGIIPIICVGETLEDRENEKTYETIRDQLKFSVPKSINHIYIAYEPIWAIGTGKTATSDDIVKMHTFIKEIIPTAKVLYGGSVNTTNAPHIIKLKNVDGLLIGGSSLDAKLFEQIIIDCEPENN
jgi:triosephosphate isomerase